LTRVARETAGDPRQSIQERYRSRAVYVQQVREAADLLVKRRYLLPEDVATIMRRADDHWNALAGQLTPTSAARSPR
jgi:hypothetical protein